MLVFDVIFDLGTHYNGRAVLKGAEKIPVQILRLFIVAWFFCYDLFSQSMLR